MHHTDQRQRIPLAIQLMLVILFVSIPLLTGLIALCMNRTGRSTQAYSIGALCAAEETETLRVSRRVTLDFAPEHGGQYHRPVLISDHYTLENTADTPCTLTLFYPSAEVVTNETKPWEDDERSGMWVDGSRVESWFCAADDVTVGADRRSGSFREKLLDGSYFAGAFPHWPELGRACYVPETGDAAETPPHGGLIYYETTLTLAPGQQSELSVCQIYDWIDALSLYPCYRQLTASDFTLEIQNAEAVRFQSQTVTDGTLGANDVLTLDPSRDDYRLEFTWQSNK